MAVSKNSKAKKQKVSKKAKTKASVEVPVEVPEPVEAPTPVEAPAPVEAPVEDPVETFMVYSDVNTLREMLRSTQSVIKEMTVIVNRLEKQINKDRKVATKKMKRTVSLNADGTKPMNGFSKPGNVSDDLRQFMGLKEDELVARVDVTKFITKYCQSNGLQNESDKRILLPDDKLQTLLQVDKTVELTYFNLQKYLKYHFPNKDGIFPSRD